MWTLAFGHHEDRTPTHGYAESREAAPDRVRAEAIGVKQFALGDGKAVNAPAVPRRRPA